MTQKGGVMGHWLTRHVTEKLPDSTENISVCNVLRQLEQWRLAQYAIKLTTWLGFCVLWFQWNNARYVYIIYEKLLGWRMIGNGTDLLMHVYVLRLTPYPLTQLESHLPSPRTLHPLLWWQCGSHDTSVTVVSLFSGLHSNVFKTLEN